MKLLCPYCGAVAGKINGRVIYPHRPDLYGKVFYQCAPCDAYVGCHPGTDRPLGRLANAELRRAKSAAHASFDPLWKQGPWTRKHAYSWLAEQLGIAAEKCHIGHFDIEQCRRVTVLCKSTNGEDTKVKVISKKKNMDMGIDLIGYLDGYNDPFDLGEYGHPHESGPDGHGQW